MSLLINLLNFWTTLRVSLVTVLEAPFRRISREAMDRRVCGWGHEVCRHAKLDLKIEGLDQLQLEPGGRYIIMCNHSSFYDIPVSLEVFKGVASVRMVAKAELFKIPLWGAAMRGAEMISIDRHDRRQAALDIARAKEKLEEGLVLWMAPEGTRSRDGRLGEFKTGGIKLAMDMSATIIPLGLEGVAQVMPPEGIAVYRGHQVTARIGTPIPTEGLPKSQRRAITAQLREEIRQLAHLPPDEPQLESSDSPAVAEDA
ncbi:MAG: lysophospholipid acyltransferase family protein [bacterium]|nr:lysophospholipid acyltransferase family protein [bacterium]